MSMNDCGDGRLIIEGVREDGRQFRPGDWIERISTAFAEFGPDHRLHYANCVQPCMINGEKCLVVGKGLAESEPEAYEHILKFARTNRLRIQEDRREQELPINTERRTNPPLELAVGS